MHRRRARIRGLSRLDSEWCHPTSLPPPPPTPALAFRHTPCSAHSWNKSMSIASSPNPNQPKPLSSDATSVRSLTNLGVGPSAAPVGREDTEVGPPPEWPHRPLRAPPDAPPDARGTTTTGVTETAPPAGDLLNEGAAARAGAGVMGAAVERAAVAVVMGSAGSEVGTTSTASGSLGPGVTGSDDEVGSLSAQSTRHGTREHG